MSSPAFVNAGQPHGALFDDAPRPYHVRDTAILRAAYGPAAVPMADPSDEDYTWTEQAAPAEVYIVPADDGARSPFLSRDDLNEMRLAELDAGLRALQVDVRHLQEIVHRLMNVGEEPDAEDSRA
jgi:hypothetical protein